MFRKLVFATTALLILSVLAGIGVGTILSPTTKTFEKRRLAQLPDFPSSAESLDGWPKQIEDWWSDAAFGRQYFLSSFNRFRESIGISPQQTVLLGKQGWLFLKIDSALEDYRNSRLYDAAELDHWYAYLMHRHRSAQAQGAWYYLVIPPNKHNVYPEYLPSHIRQLSPVSRLDQIIERMQGTGVRIIDLRPVLLDAKQIRQAYHKGDSHWNLWGANYAQYAVTEAIRQDLPDLGSYRYPIEDFVDANLKAFNQEDIHYYRALYFMMGASDRYQEAEPLVFGLDRKCVKPAPLDVGPWKNLKKAIRERIFIAEQCDSGQYRALVFRDSFAELLQPFWSTRFAYTAYIRSARPMGLNYWEHFMKAVKPDIVIDEMISRHLRHIPQPGSDYPARPGESAVPVATEEHFEFD